MTYEGPWCQTTGISMRLNYWMCAFTINLCSIKNSTCIPELHLVKTKSAIARWKSIFWSIYCALTSSDTLVVMLCQNFGLDVSMLNEEIYKLWKNHMHVKTSSVVWIVIIVAFLKICSPPDYWLVIYMFLNLQCVLTNINSWYYVQCLAFLLGVSSLTCSCSLTSTLRYILCMLERSSWWY